MIFSRTVNLFSVFFHNTVFVVWPVMLDSPGCSSFLTVAAGSPSFGPVQIITAVPLHETISMELFVPMVS